MMNVEQDEDEHSIEMHLSYIARVMESRKGQFTVVPVLVGSLSHEKQVNSPIVLDHVCEILPNMTLQGVGTHNSNSTVTHITRLKPFIYPEPTILMISTQVKGNFIKG